MKVGENAMEVFTMSRLASFAEEHRKLSVLGVLPRFSLRSRELRIPVSVASLIWRSERPLLPRTEGGHVSSMRARREIPPSVPLLFLFSCLSRGYSSYTGQPELLGIFHF